MRTAIYVCEAHVGAVVLRTHDGFFNYCPLCKAEDELQSLRSQMKWMHVSCTPENCLTSGVDCTGGAAVKL